MFQDVREQIIGAKQLYVSSHIHHEWPATKTTLQDQLKSSYDATNIRARSALCWAHLQDAAFATHIKWKMKISVIMNSGVHSSLILFATLVYVPPTMPAKLPKQQAQYMHVQKHLTKLNKDRDCGHPASQTP